MSSIRIVCFLGLVLSASAGSVISLKESDFEEHVTNSGKNAFVKFFAPWCGHCKAMAKDWETLGSDYEGSSSVLIAEVDCTLESGLCSKHGVSGYPTIKYFMSGESSPKDYNGGRQLDELKKFSADTLEIKCDVKDKKGCSEKEVKFIDTMNAKTSDDRAKELTRLSNMKAGSMKPELKQWLVQRLNVLKQLQA
jgi:protein disulfide-isomerase A6